MIVSLNCYIKFVSQHEDDNEEISWFLLFFINKVVLKQVQRDAHITKEKNVICQG